MPGGRRTAIDPNAGSVVRVMVSAGHEVRRPGCPGSQVWCLEAALELFEQHGFDGVTVEEIAAAAVVSARTFYRYFGSKEGVLFDQQDELLAVLHRTIVTEQPDQPAIAAVRAAIVTLTQHTAHLVTA